MNNLMKHLIAKANLSIKKSELKQVCWKMTLFPNISNLNRIELKFCSCASKKAGKKKL